MKYGGTLKIDPMIPHEELIQTREYWEELIDNNLFNHRTGQMKKDQFKKGCCRQSAAFD